ncbi:hypothetical protein P170DRAFT_244121 [Aspergillus steynii IBT 23096]|uniref:Uncharacterized protein n=1 Tax=Aspergillus steynii IBT 23096 TaxID=1392250 RepID=A0A2I2FXT8_9EURO|nr:uncharacterized protein P170DRAFT_244121 [Aspergillus steynii IBT 23096]PLB45440.1 hypothetical protein P170DRAFT_244121 [Aspergillus steynii IBT 23096]
MHHSWLSVCFPWELRRGPLLVCSKVGSPRSRISSAACNGAYSSRVFRRKVAKSDAKRGRAAAFVLAAGIALLVHDRGLETSPIRTRSPRAFSAMMSFAVTPPRGDQRCFPKGADDALCRSSRSSHHLRN